MSAQDNEKQYLKWREYLGKRKDTNLMFKVDISCIQSIFHYAFMPNRSIE